MSDEDQGEQNRRRAERHEVYIAAEIEPAEGGAGGVRSAITRDVSASGLLLLTRAKLEVGETVRVRVYLPGEERVPRRVKGRVVRLEKLDPSEQGMWRTKVAVALEHDATGLGAQFEALAARQAELFRKRP